MKKILVISFSDLGRDPRVRRQLHALKDEYKLTAVGYNTPNIEGVEFIPIEQRRTNLWVKLKRLFMYKARLFEEAYDYSFMSEKLIAKLKEDKYDLVIANDFYAMPLAVRVSGGAKIFLDAHEYAPKEYDDSLYWRLVFKGLAEYLTKTYINQCDRMTTVCDGIAEEYFKQYGVLPAVITNATDYAEITPAEVDGNNIRIIHHGGAGPNRKIELMIETMRHTDARYSLDLMLIPSDAKYLDKLKELASGMKNVRFVPPVKTGEIVNRINSYDIGLYILPPSNFNNEHALPNKFFEFIQARLAVAIGPSLEMARIVKSQCLGIVAEDFEPETLAKRLNELRTEQIAHYKSMSHKHAMGLSSESNMRRLREIVSDLIGG